MELLTIASLTFLLGISPSTAQLFKLSICASNHPLHGSDINASGRAFYAGLDKPTTYCPEIVNPYCPVNTLGGTIFAGLLGLPVSSL